MYTKMSIAKQAASLTTSLIASKLIAHAIHSVLDVDDDNIAVTVASALGGSYVAYKLQDTTDGLVETAAAKLETLRTQTTTEEQA